ncbi:Lsr2 family protein [Propionimicrobium sp. PCR01-08-3]|uniref:histone-like nucleoid-structuring protein Lsr2 n=1 Tax=Propionimicrobium sp. PCR01-08-3 TaxID=3052086 RepID=UPI00255C3A1F|nr:Lsr2 family protein [Propionimicrobium sp. PCR01-08-3]WIY82059.1 Lsr2 family protein [Propionimicrobium sp. PCR01-08-3]
MAQRVEIILIDDIDESPATEKVRFGLDGVNYEIDLSKKNADSLREALAPYVGAARRVRGQRARSAGSTAAAGSSPAEIRAWAADNGYEVSARGRVPAEVRAAYEAANN